MADYSFGYGGVGSGLDISTMVNQLVAAERAPQESRLNKLESAAKFKLSGLASVGAAFSSLKSALDALQKADALGARTATSSSPGSAAGADDVLGASAGRNTPVGRYTVEVLQLATAHKLQGAGVAPDTRFGAGTLRLTIGEESVDVEIAADATLADVRSAITDAAGRYGVQAALLTSDAGHHLSLGATKTGTEYALGLQLVEGGADLQWLVDGLQEQSPAADARIVIDGLLTTSASNTVTDAVPGLSLKLKQPGTSTVEVATDPAGSRAAVESFVKAYNAALKAISTATAYNAETQTPSALTGDAQMRGAASQLRNVMGELLSGLAAQGLDAKTLGLQTQGYPSADGSLVLDAAKFDAAMAANAGQIAAAFTGPDGVAATLNEAVKGYIGTDGAFTLRNQGLNDQIEAVARQREALDTRMQSVAERYRAQFVALDSLMARMTTTSNYLSQQLAALAAQTG
ncbi:flagellar filament capping protein FliD [Luteimonas huabeiensis]|uniref:flagellar filament capping protein FliD n=1 Tax=Luteimonas huabeiensis TaxID=1244513 RepID=UPI0004649983|nr:flagellar filament capping protein FliD [Luteimonas huabeiensis]